MKLCPQCRTAYPHDCAVCFLDGALLDLPRDTRVGTTVAGRYTIVANAGRGGMATVYRARHKFTGKPCALKILSVQFAFDPNLRQRFQREALNARRLAHPNIIDIFDQGDTDDGVPFLGMEMLEGETLGAAIKRSALPLERALPIAVEAARALGRAHDFEVIHRDLKPENVFLCATGSVKILDFGIARFAEDVRITSSGEVFGTPQYLAPERAHTMDVGPAADLYALGIVLFEMLTQRLPFSARDPATWMAKHMREPPPRLSTLLPNAPGALDELIDELLAKKPEDRPVDAHRVEARLVALCQAMGLALPREPALAPAPAPSVPSDPWQRRLSIFEAMRAQLASDARCAELARALSTLEGYEGERASLMAAGREAEAALSAIEREALEARRRVGAAMSARSVEFDAAREEARAVRRRIASCDEAASVMAREVVAAHKEVMRWEGRSGFVEPRLELAHAYRAVADLIEQWHELQKRARAAEGQVAEQERQMAELESRRKELRAVLYAEEKGADERRAPFQQRIAEVGGEVDGIEAQMATLAERALSPLRGEPALAALFVELAKTA